LEERDVGKNAFVSRDWMGPAAAGVVVLTGLLSHPDRAASIIIVTVATSFWWSARGRWLIGRVGLSEPKRRSRLRHAFAGQALCVLAAWGALVLIDEVVAAAAVLLVGVCLSALAWPWPWRLAQAAEDRKRAHDPSLAAQHLGAAGVLAALALGAVVALNAVAASMLAALVMSSLVEAWNERRRPHTVPRPRGDIAPQVVEVETPEPRLEQTVDYIPEFEPLDLPVVPVRPTSSPEPSRYVLFADEVAPKIEPSVEPLVAEQEPRDAERSVERSTQVWAAEVHEPVARKPVDEWWRSPMTDLPLSVDLPPLGLPSPVLAPALSALPIPTPPEPTAPAAEPVLDRWSASSSPESVTSEPRSAQQMWEDARRLAEEWTGGRAVEQRAGAHSAPEWASEPNSMMPPPDPLTSDAWTPTPVGRRARQSAAESSAPAAATWESVEPGLGRRRAEPFQAPRLEEVRNAADVQPGLGRRIAEPRDAGVFPEPRSSDAISRGLHAGEREARSAEKYTGRRVASRP
jgi:hypothetical protein